MKDYLKHYEHCEMPESLATRMHNNAIKARQYGKSAIKLVIAAGLILMLAIIHTLIVG